MFNTLKLLLAFFSLGVLACFSFFVERIHLKIWINFNSSTTIMSIIFAETYS